MRVILTGFGTTGDLQPFLVLAKALRRAGHEPVIAFSPQHRPAVERLCLAFVPIGPDLARVQHAINLQMSEIPDSAEEILSSWRPLADALPQVYADLLATCRDADLLVSGPGLPAGRMVHEVTGIPFASVQVAHFGGIGSAGLRAASRGLVNPFRERLGLPSLDDALTRDANSPQLALYAMSRHVRPIPPDWPPHFYMTGFFFLAEDWQPDRALADFLAAGDPPVVVSFGSASHGNPGSLLSLVLEAIRSVRCRAILQGWGELRDLPTAVHAAGYVPHLWLFPRASCVVHHGGAGTTAATFHAGVPGLFIPHNHIGDQLAWAQLARGLGCAGPPIPFPELTAERLAEGLVRILADDRYRRAVAALGEKVRAEAGVERARQLLENLVLKVGFSSYLLESSGRSELAERQRRVGRRHRYRERQRSLKKTVEIEAMEISGQPGEVV